MDKMSVTRLRELTDNYLAALELGQHKQVSDLSAAICAQLVELYEEGLDEKENEEEVEGEVDERLESDATQYRIVNSLCQALQKQAQLAAAYNEVIQFVHVQDMICLSQMLGAIPVKQTATTTWSYEQLAGVLRKSIYLLRSINLADKDGDGDGNGGERVASGELWLDAARLEWFRAISTFPTCAIDVGAGALRAPGARQAPIEDKEALLELCRAQRAPSSSAHLSADWFLRFLRKGPLLGGEGCPYPLDRFTLLVGLLVVGAGAGHWALQQLMGELVARVAHEESNCADEEELLQMSQTGAFWLSHYKRQWQAATGSVPPATSSPPPSSPESDSEADGSESGKRRADTQSEQDWRPRLWQLIETELIQGRACHLCGRRPDGPLAPIGNRSDCSCCSSSYHCARSHRPLHLVPLADLLRARHSAGRLVVLWPGEWARQAWAASCAQPSDARLDRKRQRPAEERLQLSDKFERLTMVQPREDSSASSRSQSDSDRSDRSDGGDRSDNSDDDGLRQSAEVPEVAARRQVAAFMRSRRRHATPGDNLSESAKLLRWLAPEGLPSLNAADLLLMGRSPDGLLQVHLATTKPAAGGDTWSCSSRSSRSGLALGCGRLFVGAGAGLRQSHNQCAHCGRPLLRLQTLAEAHRAGRV